MSLGLLTQWVALELPAKRMALELPIQWVRLGLPTQCVGLASDVGEWKEAGNEVAEEAAKSYVNAFTAQDAIITGKSQIIDGEHSGDFVW